MDFMMDPLMDPLMYVWTVQYSLCENWNCVKKLVGL